MTGKPLIGYAEARGIRPPPPRKVPKPRKPIPKVNKKRGGARFPKNRNEPLREFTRRQRCILAGRVDRQGRAHVCNGPPMCCHDKTRGSSGPDLNNTFPGCEEAHRQQEGKKKEFEYNWQLKVAMVCRANTADFKQHQKAGKV